MVVEQLFTAIGIISFVFTLLMIFSSNIPWVLAGNIMVLGSFLYAGMAQQQDMVLGDDLNQFFMVLSYLIGLTGAAVIVRFLVDMRWMEAFLVLVSVLLVVAICFFPEALLMTPGRIS
jgi:hypothetical protein